MADMVRTDSRQLRPVAGDSAGAEAKGGRPGAPALIWERTRQVQRLRTSCGSTSPPRWRPLRTWMRLMR